jgi:hypothetical protein
MGRDMRQSGAVSLFAVIFGAMLLTIVTIGFMRLMIMDQRQSSNNDLSQSAYDAALAGVEDAKRVVRAAQTGNIQAVGVLNGPINCNMVAASGVVGGSISGDTIIQTGTGAGKRFDQAYTCVKITMKSQDFIYKSIEDKSQLIPLRATSSFNKISIEWYRRDDESNLGSANAVNTEISTTGELPARNSWHSNTPQLMRVQLINPGPTFNLSTLDTTGVTSFFRPNVLRSDVAGQDGTAVSSKTSDRPRATDGNEHNNGTNIVSCSKTFKFSGEYSCKAVIDVDEIAAGSETAFLRLTSIYKGGSVKVSLQKTDGTIVNFDGVQPIVDSTGRASNLFRRVEARLQIGDDFAYPDNAIELKNSLCKDFSVSGSGSAVAGRCKP